MEKLKDFIIESILNSRELSGSRSKSKSPERLRNNKAAVTIIDEKKKKKKKEE
jgi:hypothetical protein